jgi:hypothetical protein
VEDFEVKILYIRMLEALDQDALTWFWNTECQEQLDNLIQATGLPFTVPPGEVEDCIHYNCCPRGAHIGIENHAWISTEEWRVDLTGGTVYLTPRACLVSMSSNSILLFMSSVT